MNSLSSHLIKHPLCYFRFICRIKRLPMCPPISNYYATTVDVIDIITHDLLQHHRTKVRNNLIEASKYSIQYCNDDKYANIATMTQEEIDTSLLELLSKERDKQIEQCVLECLKYRKVIGDNALKKLFRTYSMVGRPDLILVLQKYCAKVIPTIYRRNGEFLHYLAKAQCMRGNAENGLSLLKTCYERNKNLRNFYRVLFKELVHDAVLNRSEASLVIFRRYVLEFSEVWHDHYPLVCFWHLCWSSTWFSDQMLSDELFQTSESLREIIKERATALSITILRNEYNEDAVMRLLQALLKYSMMTEYTKVLQVLFNYKLRNRDLRGCSEIIRNCEVLGVTLPSDQQGRYIQLLIDGKAVENKRPPAKAFKDFKLKF